MSLPSEMGSGMSSPSSSLSNIPDSSTYTYAPTRDLLAYLSEQEQDVFRGIVNEFPLAQSKDIIFANLTDEKKYKSLIHDVNIALLTQKARLPRTLKIQADYWTAKALVELRATRAIGNNRDRILAGTQRSETVVSELNQKPKSGIRRILHL